MRQRTLKVIEKRSPVTNRSAAVGREEEGIVRAGPPTVGVSLLPGCQRVTVCRPTAVAVAVRVAVPVGVTAPVVTGETDALSVTGCLKADGFGELVTLMMVVALFTVCE